MENINWLFNIYVGKYTDLLVWFLYKEDLIFLDNMHVLHVLPVFIRWKSHRISILVKL